MTGCSVQINASSRNALTSRRETNVITKYHPIQTASASARWDVSEARKVNIAHSAAMPSSRTSVSYSMADSGRAGGCITAAPSVQDSSK